MILLAFLLPVAIYLLVLGGIHRRVYPLVVSGTTDCIGVLLASSGLLLLGGPAALSSLSERWRLFWLLGRTGSQSTSEGVWQLWIFLSVLYFLVVITLAVWLFLQHRHLTSIYNVTPETVERVLAQVFERLGLAPVRSGMLYLFGVIPPGAERPPEEKGEGREEEEAAWAQLAGQGTVLEVDFFPAMRHVSLRWDPARSPLRQTVEHEVEKILSRTPSPPSEVAAWLTLSGLGLLVLFLLGSVAILVARLLI